MVVKKEFAVLFKRKKIDEFKEEFIPFKVIEGAYNEVDHWFIDLDDVAYPHIAEPMVSGLCYGNRVAIEKEEEEFTEEFIEITKQELLNLVSNVIFTRDRKQEYYINIKLKDKDEEYIFEDDDTQRLYSQYDEMYEDFISDEEYTPELNMTPLEISEKVKETIKGQDEAVKKIVTAIWTTIKFENMTKKNMLVIGPSGVGKTAIFKKLGQILGIPLTICSVSGLSQAGYAGRNVDEILSQIFYDNNGDISKAQRSIVILDEIDKLAYGEGKSGDVATSGVQNELLKIIEGCQRVFEIQQAQIPIDTSKILFIGIGAFSELHEEKKEEFKTIQGFGEYTKPKSKKSNKISNETLHKYGMKRELLGRMPVVVELNAMTKEILTDIILNSDESEFRATIDALDTLGIKVNNLEELINIITDDALAKGIGARGLVSTVNNIFSDIFYEVTSNPEKYKSVTIGNNILNDYKDYELVTVKTKRRVKNNDIEKEIENKAN